VLEHIYFPSLGKIRLNLGRLIIEEIKKIPGWTNGQTRVILYAPSYNAA